MRKHHPSNATSIEHTRRDTRTRTPHHGAPGREGGVAARTPPASRGHTRALAGLFLAAFESQPGKPSSLPPSRGSPPSFAFSALFQPGCPLRATGASLSPLPSPGPDPVGLRLELSLQRFVRGKWNEPSRSWAFSWVAASGAPCSCFASVGESLHGLACSIFRNGVRLSELMVFENLELLSQ